MPWYLPAALLVKTPLGMLVLWLAGAAVLLAVRRLRPAAVYLLLPPAVLLAVATLGARNLGTRYVIVVPIFLAVAAAAVTLLRSRRVAVIVAALVAFVAVSSLRTFPYYLPYGNEAFGGPAATARHLHDSNVDWGQDLGRLGDRLRERYPGQTGLARLQGQRGAGRVRDLGPRPAERAAGPGPRAAGRLRQPRRPRRPDRSAR